jgi:hypothetical protein
MLFFCPGSHMSNCRNQLGDLHPVPAGPLRQVLFNVIKKAVEVSPVEGPGLLCQIDLPKRKRMKENGDDRAGENFNRRR